VQVRGSRELLSAIKAVDGDGVRCQLSIHARLRLARRENHELFFN
jgi:hypothetical protein